MLLDAFDRRRRRSLEEGGFELDAVCAVVDPGPARLDELTGRDHCGMATRVMRSRWPRALTRSTQKPLSELWKVTRSTKPAKTSVELAVRVRAIPGPGMPSV